MSKKIPKNFKNISKKILKYFQKNFKVFPKKILKYFQKTFIVFNFFKNINSRNRLKLQNEPKKAWENFPLSQSKRVIST